MSSFSFRLTSCCLLLALALGVGGCTSSTERDSLAQMNRKTKAVAAQQQKASLRAKSAAPPQPLPAPATSAAVAPVETAPLGSSSASSSLAPPFSSTLPAPSAIRSTKIQVALLLPLSGRNAALGQAMLNAAQIAVFDMGSTDFELMPRDTGAGGEAAASAAQEAITGGARLLIGPLFAADVAAVKPIVQTSNVNMLALSTDVSLAEPGAYVMGFAPAPQVERVVAYAAQHGASRFAALIPASPYGALVKTAFEDAVRKNNGKIVALESPQKAEALAARKGDFDALFLPLAGNELKAAVQTLATAGFDSNKVRLLGTGLWDDPEIGQTPLLVGGIYAASEPSARAAFVAAYKNAYGQEPPRLATLAYDATALAAVLAGNGARFDRQALGNPSGFAGLDGLFRLTAQGTAERGLAINEITAVGSRVLDPSPSTFVRTY
jgi:ABC-type branched-subunit amino acid transport system substrate-binding protein